MSRVDTDRRKFLVNSGLFLGLTALNPLERLMAAPKFQKNPFSLGIASGDPAPDGVVLWTRLALDPVNGGGMPPEAVPVEYRVATDEKMANVVAKGMATASPDLAHTVHVELKGLKPDAWYFYQFSAGSWETAVGRTRTAPLTAKDKLRFAFASCQHYETGYYTAYQHMAEEDLDLVIHLGDYIYEGGVANEARPRKHNSKEILSLNDYRNRYALYKGDALLQRAHARFPWIVTWDDHEVDNDYANDFPEDGMARTAFLERRAGAYQAYYEHMPLRRSSLPKGSNLQLYRNVGYGPLGEIFVLDTRQYRSPKPCGGKISSLCAQTRAAEQTILGKAQREWLMNGLAKSQKRWNIVANQVMMASLDLTPGPEQSFSMDKWTGYVGERQKVFDFLAERKVRNMVVVTGDIHTNWTSDLKLDFNNPKSPNVGVEFVGTSISSSGDGQDQSERGSKQMAENPHVLFHNANRGYVSCTVTERQMRADYRIVPYVSKPGAPVQTRASFVVEHNKPAAQKA